MGDDSQAFLLRPIAIARTPFKEKFGIPRQPGLASIEARIVMLPPFDEPELFDGLEAFSHIWLNFIFHEVSTWKRRVRPPRLGGNRKKGVFATRSPFRPNRLGLSVVRLLSIEWEAGEMCLRVEGVDLLDGTPIVDIRPYLPYVDSLPQAESGFASQAPSAQLRVAFNQAVEMQLQALPEGCILRAQIEALLALDPRPAYHRNQTQPAFYGMRFANWNVRWQVADGQVTVIRLEKVQSLDDEAR